MRCAETVRGLKDRERIRAYLDGVISYWQGERDCDIASAGHKFMATCYVDAYQSAMVSLLGYKKDKGK